MPSLAQQAITPSPAVALDKPPVIVVGTGPVGIHLAHELLKCMPDQDLVVYGDEPWVPYNRVRLSSLLAGEVDSADLENTLSLPQNTKVVQHLSRAVVAVDRQDKTITDALGQTQPYSTLVLATGSRPHMPNINGIHLPGVYTFRDMNDAQLLAARRVRSRRTIVLGGGLLGLEAAKAMQRHNTNVYIIEHGPYLMHHQLDEQAGESLREHLLSLGIQVILADGIKKITGDFTVTGVELHSGREIACDTIIVAAGIKPNIQLALDCGLHVGRGIKVNDNMQTSDPSIYAIGECAEHRDTVYGLVKPGLEQAAVAAHHINGVKTKYVGSTAATRLKVVGRTVFSMGIVGQQLEPTLHRKIIYQQPGEGIYRAITLRNRHVVGAVALGGWDELGRIQEAVTNTRPIWPWQILRFRQTGRLWAEQSAQDVNNWPAQTTVCNCTGITRGVLSQAITQGYTTFAALSQTTRASTVCGSCRPLLNQLLGTADQTPERKKQHTLLTGSITALVLSAFILSLTPIPYTSTVTGWRFDNLWIDGFWKQVSGYSLLALSLIGLLLSLRKRWKRFSSLGDFSIWRNTHIVLGVLLLGTLIVHTGLHLGENLNFILILFFLGLTTSGALAGQFLTQEKRLGALNARRLRSGINWIHILLFWPVPALLGFHILSVYYF